LLCNLYEWHDPWDSIYIRWTELPFIHQRRLENIDTMWSITLVMISLLRLTAATIVTAEAENESISTARNTTRSFRLRLKVTHGDRKYNWVLQPYHIVAALSATVFEDPALDDGAILRLNNTSLQLDGPSFPWFLNAPNMVAGHSRWLQVYFEPGDGTDGFADHGSSGIGMDSSSSRWMACLRMEPGIQYSSALPDD